MPVAVEKFLDLLTAIAAHSRSSYYTRDRAYTHSYRAIRLAVGFLGIALPITFFFVEGFLLRGGVHVRGSLSAYYHSPVQDIFVGALSVIGVLLMTYMAGETKTYEFEKNTTRPVRFSVAASISLNSNWSSPRFVTSPVTPEICTRSPTRT